MYDLILKKITNLEDKLSRYISLSQRSEVTGGFSRVTYADLPTPNLTGGRAYYCTNCRKAGEGIGAGTGAYIGETNVSGVAQWVRLDDQTTTGIAAA